MIAEYALAYGPPDPSMPWPMFVLLVQRTNQAFARRLLATMHGVGWAIGKAFGGSQTLQLDMMRVQVERVAFPGQKSKGSVFGLKQSQGG